MPLWSHMIKNTTPKIVNQVQMYQNKVIQKIQIKELFLYKLISLSVRKLRNKQKKKRKEHSTHYRQTLPSTEVTSYPSEALWLQRFRS